MSQQNSQQTGGKMAIKYDADLNKRILRAVKNFNAKVRYNKTKTRNKGMLPRTISAKVIKDKYSDKSRAELIKQLTLYESFGKRSSLDKAEGSRLSKWEQNYFEENREKTREFYQNEIKDLERIIDDKPEIHLRQNERLTNLQRRLDKLDKDLSTLDEDEIKSLRAVYNYAERSDIVKRQSFRLYLSQLTRTMQNLGYSKEEINALLDKFDTLSENEFMEMMQNEDLIDVVYDLIDSPKGRGKYELMTDEVRARGIVTDIQNRADSLIAKYKSR